MLLRRQAGFTLFELMIVLLILAAVSSAVAITASSTSSPEKRLDESGKKLFAQMQFALDESLIQQQLIGLRIDADGDIADKYSWHSYNDNSQWQALESGVLVDTQLPEDIVIDATIDDVLLEALLEQSLNDDRELLQSPPNIIFYPSGDISEFTLTLSLMDNTISDYQLSIFIDERGQLSNSIIANQ
jgi:general secretion pathway protein H